MMTSLNPTYFAEAGKEKRIHEYLTRASSEYADAAEFLREYGVTTELAQKADVFLNAPLEFIYNSKESLGQYAAKFLHAFIVGYIKTNAATHSVASLWQIGSFEELGLLAYNIVLHDYNLENRAPFREFRSNYADSGLEEIVPLVFNFLPIKLASGIQNATEIALT